ncbi:VOC family protein [uncultured Mitsuokella sp.]|uniref:VOC family protein n=1 Tax=uncultured Mitsuokella sp. TaxID=453120 RepID=UPI002605FCEF|nr:VOC family protein [uncultured Mitsuokella sp.]
MKFKNIDHIVITTQDLKACLHFYVDILGMELDQRNGRYAVRFGSQKFNIHTRTAEFLPAAEHPTYGSLDLCLILDGSLDMAKAEIERKGYPIELRPVTRHGACGEMRSIYLRDPDGNLIELAEYHK